MASYSGVRWLCIARCSGHKLQQVGKLCAHKYQLRCIFQNHACLHLRLHLGLDAKPLWLVTGIPIRLQYSNASAKLLQHNHCTDEQAKQKLVAATLPLLHSKACSSLFSGADPHACISAILFGANLASGVLSSYCRLQLQMAKAFLKHVMITIPCLKACCLCNGLVEFSCRNRASIGTFGLFIYHADHYSFGAGDCNYRCDGKIVHHTLKLNKNS